MIPEISVVSKRLLSPSFPGHEIERTARPFPGAGDIIRFEDARDRARVGSPASGTSAGLLQTPWRASQNI